MLSKKSLETFKLTSVIIPCYNSGEFLPEAIASVVNSGFPEVELIIVNDGSTDPYTLEVLSNLDSNQIKLLSQENQGPAAARNSGVKEAKGEFLLFLDADNLILPGYIQKASSLLKANSRLGVVYANPIFFGETDSISRFYPQPYDIKDLLLGNYIDMCSIVRRQVFADLGGFDEHRDLIGWEDWEFWLRVAQTNWEFHYLNESLFKYRIRRESLMGQSTAMKKDVMLAYLGAKHGKFFHKQLRSAIRTNKIVERRTIQFWLKKWFLKSS